MALDHAAERAFREDAMAWLQRHRDQGKEFWTQPELADFHWRGERIALMDRQRGIRKPRQLDAAVSIRTVFRPAGAIRPYADDLGDDQLLRYKWNGENADHADNRALRVAAENALPLIYFDGFATGMYAAIWPVYLIDEEPAQHQFVVAVGDEQRRWSRDTDPGSTERLFRARTTLQRLHQPRFRAGVMIAYEQRCAICLLRHAELLDAAHIIGDKLDGGDPITSNGLSMCKIHHSAYDANIIGIRPDLQIEVNPTILREVDGPMLQFGIQGVHGQRLGVVPKRRTDKPDPTRLEQRYEEFRAARR